jgi:amino acid transporter
MRINNIKRQIFNGFVITIMIGSILLIPAKAIYGVGFNDDLTQKMGDQEQAFKDAAGYDDSSSASLTHTVAGIIKAFLGLLGVIFIILMLLAGYNWMTAGGEEEKVNKAKDTIKRAIIGLLIIALAYSITYFIFNNLPFGGGGSSQNANTNN